MIYYKYRADIEDNEEWEKFFKFEEVPNN